MGCGSGVVRSGSLAEGLCLSVCYSHGSAEWRLSCHALPRGFGYLHVSLLGWANAPFLRSCQDAGQTSATRKLWSRDLIGSSRNGHIRYQEHIQGCLRRNKLCSELFDLILSNLGIKDIPFQMRFTCRAFRDMINSSPSIEGILAMINLLAPSLRSVPRTRVSQTIASRWSTAGL